MDSLLLGLSLTFGMVAVLYAINIAWIIYCFRWFAGEEKVSENIPQCKKIWTRAFRFTIASQPLIFVLLSIFCFYMTL